MKSIGAEEFFKLVAVNSGVPDIQTVKDIYYGMVRTMSREIRDKHTIKLPDWGEFSLKVHKSRKMVSVNTGKLTIIPPKPTVKFTSDYKVKKYFYALGEQSTML